MLCYTYNTRILLHTHPTYQVGCEKEKAYNLSKQKMLIMLADTRIQHTT